MTDPRDPGAQQPPGTPPSPEGPPPANPPPMPAPPPASTPPPAQPTPDYGAPTQGYGAAPPPPPAPPPAAWPPAGSPPPSAWPPAGTPPPAVPWDAPKEDAGPAPGVKFASHGPRLIAYIVDGLIVGAVFIAIFLVFGTALFAGAGISGFDNVRPSDFEDGRFSPVAAGAAIAFGLFILLGIVVSLAYFPFFWARSGQTPGMKLFGLYVVRDSDGGKISGGQAVLRLIGLWISGIPFYLGYIWIFIDARRRGWHDLIAGTVMIERAR